MGLLQQRAGVRHLLTKNLQDGFLLQGVAFINPFKTKKRSINR